MLSAECWVLPAECSLLLVTIAFMNRMIVANLAYRPVRSIISIVAVGVEVTLIMLIVGLALGMLNDSKNRQEGIGADVMVRPRGTTILSAFSGAARAMHIAQPNLYC